MIDLLRWYRGRAGYPNSGATAGNPKKRLVIAGLGLVAGLIGAGLSRFVDHRAAGLIAIAVALGLLGAVILVVNLVFADRPSFLRRERGPPPSFD